MQKLISQNTRLFLSQWMPQSLGRIFYFPFLLWVRLFAKAIFLPRGISAAVWPRNSFITPNFVPFLSDLDLTLFLNGPPQSNTKDGLRLLRRATAYLAFPGELNVYETQHLETIISLFNPFELDRDPRLKSKFERSQTKERSTIEAAIFILRMIESDAKGLCLFPDRRKGKWRGHIQNVLTYFPNFFSPSGKPQEIPDQMLLESLLEGCLKHTIPPDLHIYLGEATQSLKAYIHHLANGYPNHLFPHNTWTICHFPHKSPDETHWLLPIARQLKETIIAQLRWELFGLFTQAPNKADPLVALHVTNLESLFLKSEELHILTAEDRQALTQVLHKL